MDLHSRVGDSLKEKTMDQSLPSHPDVALNLALAVIASSYAPVLLLDGDLTVLAASTSFCQAFAIAPSKVIGRLFRDIGVGEWDVPKLSSLLRATASGLAEIEGFEMDFSSKGRVNRRLILGARKLHYGAGNTVRLILTVSDVTDARLADKLKEELLQQKAVLLQELQHRVANSLQIIASVLMQSARKVQSDESRSHLHDAHHRVMSVAALQKQLATSNEGDVELRPYFTALCQSIGASMIRDHNQLSLDVSVDNSVIGADVSVSLGLIVTELVINALKHAFPDHRDGKITVDYRATGLNWTLKVSDDGVGMPTTSGPAKPGLGTSIVHALADQLHAEITVSDAKPGTAVSIARIKTPALNTDVSETEMIAI